MNPSELACSWFGHLLTELKLGMHHRSDGDDNFKMFVYRQCTRCGWTSEVDVSHMDPPLLGSFRLQREVNLWWEHHEATNDHPGASDPVNP